MKNVFEHVIHTPDIKYKHAKGMRDVFGKEFHRFHEIFLFVGGEAFFTTEQKTIRLKPYTLITIPENTFHSFHVVGDEADYERYVLNFYNTKKTNELIIKNMTRVSVIERLPACILTDLASLDDNKYSDHEKKTLTAAKLLCVLVELGHLVPCEEDRSSKFSRTTTKCLDYINQNLCSSLTVAELSKKLNYSRSALTHAFKADLEMPLYRYIIEKKLIYAHKEINAGVSATEAARKYGFSDYSCFYRHYKNYFGASPSERPSKW